MLRFVITAGGTEENIDGVRKITNFSTGNLGWLILEALLSKMEEAGLPDFEVFYIHGTHAAKKTLPKHLSAHVNFRPVTDAQSAHDTVCAVLQNNAIDVFIHSMAVSDFTFSWSASAKILAREISESITAKEKPVTDDVARILHNPGTKFEEGQKISSSGEIILGLKPTPKIIAQIKRMRPEIYLVGFKLLRNVPENELLETARELGMHTHCDAVLANDLSDITEKGHKAVLLQKNNIIGKADDKKSIAEMIVNHCLTHKKDGI